MLGAHLLVLHRGGTPAGVQGLGSAAWASPDAESHAKGLPAFMLGGPGHTAASCQQAAWITHLA